MPSNPKSVLRRLMPTAHRILIERCIKRDFVHLSGRVLVIGAGHDPYRDLLPSAQSVKLTDISNDSGLMDEIADAHELQFENGSFDVVIAIEVFEHLHTPTRAIHECQRVLSNGGLLLFSIPFMFHVHGDPDDYQRFTKSGLARLTSDFGTVDIEEVGGRLATISDICTTAFRGVIPLRVLNNLFRIPLIGNLRSHDCASGYWIKAKKLSV